jgi:predicted nucleic acid-binding protein
MRGRPEPQSLFRLVFDSSALIFIERHGKMGILRRRRTEVLLPEKIADEVSRGNYPLRRFVRKYPTVVMAMTPHEERRYLQIRQQPEIHDGESASIALAGARGFPLVIDDARARRKAENHGIRCGGWQDFVRGRL